MNNHCLNCDAVIRAVMTWGTLLFGGAEKQLCDRCQRKLVWLPKPACVKCSRSLAELPSEYIHDQMCHDCFRWEDDANWAGMLSCNVSLYQYNEFLKELLARYKYRGDYVLAKAFSEEVRKAVFNMTFDLIVPIPLSDERLLERGFNQAAALAKEAGFDISDELIRIHGEKQSKKSREERIHLRQVFQVKDTDTIVRKNILLIDDIYTTGSTLRHAAHAMKKAGARQVSSITLARG